MVSVCDYWNLKQGFQWLTLFFFSKSLIRKVSSRKIFFCLLLYQQNSTQKNQKDDKYSPKNLNLSAIYIFIFSALSLSQYRACKKITVCIYLRVKLSQMIINCNCSIFTALLKYELPTKDKNF